MYHALKPGLFLALALSLQPLSTATADNSTECAPPKNWQAIMEKAQGKVIVFGELHGTQEYPKLVGEFICAAAKQGRQVLFLMEQGADKSEALNATLNSQDEEPWEAATPDFWHAKSQDGRKSQAMHALLERLRALKQGGADISVGAFGATIQNFLKLGRPEGIEWVYEEETVHLSTALKNNDLVISLVGSFHPVKYAEHAAREKIFAINHEHKSGTAWVCSEGVCGEKPYKASKDVERFAHHAPSTLVFPEEDMDTTVYSAYLYTGSVTASPPAFAK